MPTPIKFKPRMQFSEMHYDEDDDEEDEDDIMERIVRHARIPLMHDQQYFEDIANQAFFKNFAQQGRKEKSLAKTKRAYYASLSSL